MAQAVVLSVPNLWQVIVDDTVGTQTFQTYDTTTSAWVTQWTLNLSTGAVTLAQGQTVSGNQSVSGTLGVTGAATLSDTLAVTGAATLSSTLAVTDAVTAGGINPANAVNALAGTTAGTIYWTMPFQGSGYKKILFYLDAYENDTANAQTITYPTAFVHVLTAYNSSGILSADLTVTTTEITFNPDSTAVYTGWIILEGY